MRFRIRSLIASTLILSVTNVHADLVDPESFSVASIHFGDGVQQVNEVAKRLKLVLTRESEYMQDGDYPRALSYQLFSKPCDYCHRPPTGDSYERLEIQYSRVTGKVIAIARNMLLDPAVNKTEMIKTIEARFGPETSEKIQTNRYQYSWTNKGRLETIYNLDRHCSISSLPTNVLKPNCSYAAFYSFTTAPTNPDLVQSQYIMVIDWASYQAELDLANQSVAAKTKRDTESSKQIAVPKP